MCEVFELHSGIQKIGNKTAIYFSFFCFFLFYFFYCCSSTSVPILPQPWPSTPPIPTSHPCTYPLWLCTCVFYMCSLTALPLSSPIIRLLFPLVTISLFFISMSLVIFCLFVLLTMFHVYFEQIPCQRLLSFLTCRIPQFACIFISINISKFCSSFSI